MLAGGGGLEVGERVPQPAQGAEMEFRVGLFLFGRLEENRRDLLVAFLLRDGRVIGVFVAGLGFAGKGFPQVLFGLATFEFGHGGSPLFPLVQQF